MNILIDTSAFLAILNASDRFHPPAREAWNELLNSEITPCTSNYILLETTALLQHRFGIDAVRLLEGDLLPIVEIYWVDQPIHEQGMSALLAANRRDLSLVDCTSFEFMRQRGLKKVFTFDPHFAQQGFEVLP